MMESAVSSSRRHLLEMSCGQLDIPERDEHHATASTGTRKKLPMIMAPSRDGEQQQGCSAITGNGLLYRLHSEWLRILDLRRRKDFFGGECSR
jgi:hypothetical protein